LPIPETGQHYVVGADVSKTVPARLNRRVSYLASPKYFERYSQFC